MTDQSRYELLHANSGDIAYVEWARGGQLHRQRIIFDDVVEGAWAAHLAYRLPEEPEAERAMPMRYVMDFQVVSRHQEVA